MALQIADKDRTDKVAHAPVPVLPLALTLSRLLVGYVGAYYATVEPFARSRVAVGEPGAIASYPLWFAPDRWQITVDDWLDRLFTPIHWLDRRIRPKVWGP